MITELSAVPFLSISQDLGMDQDDMSLGTDVYNMATFCKSNLTNKPSFNLLI